MKTLRCTIKIINLYQIFMDTNRGQHQGENRREKYITVVGMLLLLSKGTKRKWQSQNHRVNHYKSLAHH